MTSFFCTVKAKLVVPVQICVSLSLRKQLTKTQFLRLRAIQNCTKFYSNTIKRYKKYEKNIQSFPNFTKVGI